MRSIRCTRSVLFGLQILSALVWLPSLPVSAEQVPASSVEFPVWSRSWVGTLGSKQVEVELNRTADGLSGSYCYQPCRAETRRQLVLNGRIRGEGAALTERDSGDGAAETGTWRIESFENVITGTWTSPNGERMLPLALSQIQDDLKARFPYEIRLLADALPEEEGDGCPTPPLVSGCRSHPGNCCKQQTFPSAATASPPSETAAPPRHPASPGRSRSPSASMSAATTPFHHPLKAASPASTVASRKAPAAAAAP